MARDLGLFTLAHNINHHENVTLISTIKNQQGGADNRLAAKTTNELNQQGRIERCMYFWGGEVTKSRASRIGSSEDDGRPVRICH